MLKNKRHFVLLQLWHLIAVKIGENAEVRPLLVPVSHDAADNGLIFRRGCKDAGLDACLQVEDSITSRCDVQLFVVFSLRVAPEQSLNGSA